MSYMNGKFSSKDDSCKNQKFRQFNIMQGYEIIGKFRQGQKRLTETENHFEKEK